MKDVVIQSVTVLVPYDNEDVLEAVRLTAYDQVHAKGFKPTHASDIEVEAEDDGFMVYVVGDG